MSLPRRLLGWASPALAVLVMLAGAGVLAASSQAGAAEPSAAERVTRHAGTGRIATAVAVSRAAFTDDARRVVVATAGRYPDALAGSVLAAAGGGPVLLTAGEQLESGVADEIARLDPDVVTVLGGPQAVSENVVDELEARDGATVRRVHGTTRFETAARVAGDVVDADGAHAYVVQGQHDDPARGWPDAVAVSALAGHQQAPVLLVTRDRVPDSTAEAIRELNLDRVTIVGGGGAVSGDVAQSLRRLGVDVGRVGGSTRYATSVAVAERSAEAGLDAARPWLVTGGDWPDALAAGPAAAHTGEALVLVDGSDLDRSAPGQRWLVGTPRLRRATLVGAEQAMSTANERDLGALAATAGRDGHSVAAAGDIACDPNDQAWDAADACRHADTADLAAEADSVVALGDLQYRAATRSNLAASYDPTWGEFKDRTYPVPGNHEYYVDGARDYFSYFGARVGGPSPGYYATTLGQWEVLSLDSNCDEHGGCADGSAQQRWLRQRLALGESSCQLAVMHHPPFTSGPRAGVHEDLAPLLDELDAADVDVLLAAHTHSYERLRRATPSGAADPDGGLRSFVVGTGGANVRPLADAAHPLTVARTDQHFGVLRLELYDDGYVWAFDALADSGHGGGSFADVGFGSCR